MPNAARGQEYLKGETLYVSLELSSKTWKLTSAREEAGKIREKNVPAGDFGALWAELSRAKAKLGLGEDARVVSCYEAGRDGFWIHRELVAGGVMNLVVDASSLQVNRRKRRRKTDRIDGRKLLDHLFRWCRGDGRCWSVVEVPSVEAEDARQLHRELGALKKERTRHSNRIRSLLFTQGITVELDSDFLGRLEEARLHDGRPLPEHLREQLVREHERWSLVKEQIATLERERREVLRTSEEPAVEKARKLIRLRGIGENAGWLWSMEFFGWRHFGNRGQVGSLAGLTPTPSASGNSFWEQGIDKAGNPRVRAMAIEIAWCWIRFQPDSELTLWWKRFATTPRTRRVGIVALARKLLVALWRYLEYDCIPKGARLKAV